MILSSSTISMRRFGCPFAFDMPPFRQRKETFDSAGFLQGELVTQPRPIPCASACSRSIGRSHTYEHGRPNRSPQGTLDLLPMRVVALGPIHGYAINPEDSGDFPRGSSGAAGFASKLRKSAVDRVLLFSMCHF